MIKKVFILILSVFSTVTVYGQSVTKNLVYKSTSGGFEKDGNWFYTVSPNGRFVVLGCGNYQLSKKSTINICGNEDVPFDVSNLQVYDTSEKKLRSINLSSVFTPSTNRAFIFTFSQNSSFVIAELPADFEFDTPDDFVPTEYKQKIANVNLSTSLVEAEFVSTGGQICTQIAYINDQIICAQNTFRKVSEDGYSRDLDLVFYDTKFSRVLKSVAVSKDKSFTMIPQLNETEFVTDRSSRPAKMLVATEDLGGNLHTTGESFSIDLKTGDIQLIPELDTEKQRSEIRFIGNYNLNNSMVSLYLLAYYPKFDGPDNTPKKDSPQFLILNKKSASLIDAPKAWGDFSLASVLGVRTNNNGLPVVFRSEKLRNENDTSQISIKEYSLFTGDESTILSMKFDEQHFNNYMVWDDNSESFFLLNGVLSESSDESYTISEIQQVDVSGATVQKIAVVPIKQGLFYLNPRSSNPVLIEYSDNGAALFSSIFVYSAVKRKMLLIDRENFTVPVGAYNAPIFANDKGVVILSTIFDKQDYSIYHYEY